MLKTAVQTSVDVLMSFAVMTCCLRGNLAGKMMALIT